MYSFIRLHVCLETQPKVGEKFESTVSRASPWRVVTLSEAIFLTSCFENLLSNNYRLSLQSHTQRSLFLKRADDRSEREDILRGSAAAAVVSDRLGRP